MLTEEKIEVSELASDDGPDHIVCVCQEHAIPRLSLCGADCTLLDYGRENDVCAVCYDALAFVQLYGRCKRCPR